MNTTKISHVAHLVEICVYHGIKQVVVSPGSRNAPLVIAFDAHPNIETFVVHDERSAAFFALGLAEASHTPVAITCTSGSAPINYAPAISEAYYRNIPLLVLTADRPVKWIDQGDGQTIRQKNLFQNFIKASFELPDFPSKLEREQSDRTVNEALKKLFNYPQGPVHVNIPLDEPLYDMEELTSIPVFEKQEQIRPTLSAAEQALIAEGWRKAKKKLVLIGQLPAKTFSAAVLSPLLNDPSVAILVENTTNVCDFKRIVHCIDRTLAFISEDELQDFAPDLLVTMGGAIISKKIKAFFRKHKPQTNWRVGEYFFEEDTYQSLTASFKVHPAHFLHFIQESDIPPTSNFGSKWKQADFMAEEKHLAYLRDVPFSDLGVFNVIFDTLPDSANLHMANSSVVRYGQLFNPISSVTYYSNRGVSGIDGSTSTAVGIAKSDSKQLNVLISGDVSFFYDSNGLWNSYLSSFLRIIVINNGGGGIFKIIDGPGKTDQLNYFVAPFKASVKGICEAFDVNYMLASSFDELEASLEHFYTVAENDRPILLEVDTQNQLNDNVLKAYFQSIPKPNP